VCGGRCGESASPCAPTSGRCRARVIQAMRGQWWNPAGGILLDRSTSSATIISLIPVVPARGACSTRHNKASTTTYHRADYDLRMPVSSRRPTPWPRSPPDAADRWSHQAAGYLDQESTQSRAIPPAAPAHAHTALSRQVSLDPDGIPASCWLHPRSGRARAWTARRAGSSQAREAAGRAPPCSPARVVRRKRRPADKRDGGDAVTACSAVAPCSISGEHDRGQVGVATGLAYTTWASRAGDRGERGPGTRPVAAPRHAGH